MAESYSGWNTRVLVAGQDDAGDGVSHSLVGLASGVTITNQTIIEAGYYLGNPVMRQLVVRPDHAIALQNLRRGDASKAMQEWVEAGDGTDASERLGWVFVVANPGARVRFGQRVFTGSDFTNDFVTIVGQEITMMQHGPLYRNRGVHAAVEFTGTSDPTPTVGDIAASDKIVFVCTDFAGTGTADLTLAGATVSVNGKGAFEFSGGTQVDTSGAALSSSGTFTQCDGEVFVGKEIT